MRLLLFSLLSVCMASAASAACLFQRTDFIPSEQGLEQLKLPLAIMSASPRIQVFGPDKKLEKECSSAVVSDNGTILTAGHCLEFCLWKNHVYQKDGKLLLIDKSKLASADCSVAIDGKMMPAHVLAINPCLEQQQLSTPQAAKKCPGISYALIQVDPAALSGRSCFPVANRQVEPGEPVAAVGYPDRTYRGAFKPGARDSAGSGAQYVSIGKITTAQSICSSKKDGSQQSLPATEVTRQLLAKVQAGEVLQTTVDIIGGSSGGGLIDSRGELVGLASYVEINNRYAECSGGTFFSSAGAILDNIRSEYPNLNLKQALSCRAHSIGGPNRSKTSI